VQWNPVYSVQPIPCPVLNCVLPFSNYPYIEALRSVRQEQVFGALSRCVEFFDLIVLTSPVDVCFVDKNSNCHGIGMSGREKHNLVCI